MLSKGISGASRRPFAYLRLMGLCFFATDLHGSLHRCRMLFRAILTEFPDGVFLGGDLLPGMLQMAGSGDFIGDHLTPEMEKLRDSMGERYPRVFLILGNDDGRCEEEGLLQGEKNGLWEYVHGKRVSFGEFPVYGYSFVPPTPFRLKDWEKYDVSRFVDPGCTHPYEGIRTVEITAHETRYSTIAVDLEELTGNDDLSRAIMLFHAPPYGGVLDRAALDGVKVDHAPLDVHVGSIAIQRFIEKRQPLLTMHGHVHEAFSITGRWVERIGRTCCLGGAHNGKELALVRFDPMRPGEASRELL